VENVGEPKEKRKSDSLLVQIEGQGIKVESLIRVAIGMNGEMTKPVDAEVTDAPTFDVIEIEGIANGPVFFWNPRILPGKRER
jgi:hypothetical protein